MTSSVSILYLLAGLLTLDAQRHECLIQDGREANGDDSSCESYWECDDGQGTLQQCEGDSQFDFVRRVCLHNREVWCQWQYDTVQQRGGLAGTPFDPRRPVNTRKPWLQGQGSLTYTGSRAVNSFTHTHDGSTHVHLLDANGRYVDTTDHFHQYPRPQGPRRQQKREAGHDNPDLTPRGDAANIKAAKQLNAIHKTARHEQGSNSRSQQLGIDYDVMALKTGHGDRDDVKKHDVQVDKDYKDIDATGDDDGNADYDDVDSGFLICGHASRHEPNTQDLECKTFWECSKYKVTQMECDEGYRFDLYLKDCRPHQEVDCKGQLQKFHDEEPGHRAEVEVKDDGVTVVHHFYHKGKPVSSDLKPGSVQQDINKFEQEGERSVMGRHLDNKMTINGKQSDIYINNDDLKTSPHIASKAKMSLRSARHSEGLNSFSSEILLNPFMAFISRQRNLQKFARKHSSNKTAHDDIINEKNSTDLTPYSMDDNQTAAGYQSVADNKTIQVISLPEEIQPPMQRFRSTILPYLSPEMPEAFRDLALHDVQHERSITPMEVK